MTPAAILKATAADGVLLSLSSSGAIKAAGDQTAVTRWLPAIREHKPGIVAILAGVAYRWRLHFADSEPLEVAYSPPATHGEALAAFPEALAAEPWPDQAKGTPATSCEAGNAKPGLPLGHLPKI